MGAHLTQVHPTKPAPISWVEKLFERMEALYGTKFLDMWRNTNADLVKALWADEMGKLSADELRRGYAALMSRDWPPSLPEFLKMCRPPLDPLNAYREALKGLQSRERGEVGTWSHPAIFWAYTAVSAHDLKSMSYDQIEKRWAKALQDELDKGEWAAIPVPMPALPEPGKSKLSREHAEKMMQELHATGTIKKANDKTDHKQWARRILERAQKPNHGLSYLQIRFAKEALAAPEK